MRCKKYLDCGVPIKSVMKEIGKKYEFVETTYMNDDVLDNGEKYYLNFRFTAMKIGMIYYIVFPAEKSTQTECIVVKEKK